MQNQINDVVVDLNYKTLLNKIEEYGLNLEHEDINAIYQKFLEKRVKKKFIPVDQLIEITIMETMK
mgnify:CR=1 FL=1